MKNSVLRDMSKKDRIDFYISIPIILAALAFIIYYSFSDTQAPTKENKPASIILENTMDIDEVIVEEQVYIPYASKSTKQKSAKKKKTQIRESKHVATNDSTGIHKEYTEGTESVKETLEKDTTAQVDSLSISTSSDSTGMTNVDQNIDKESKIEDNVTSNTPPVTTSSIEQSDCIIIIGAFKKQANINQLKRKLKREAYKVFETPYKGMTRIGIYHNCVQQELEKTLKVVRKKYAKDAMVLVAE